MKFNVGDKVRILPGSTYDLIDEEAMHKVEGTVGTVTKVDVGGCMVAAGVELPMHMFEDGQNFHLCFYNEEMELTE